MKKEFITLLLYLLWTITLFAQPTEIKLIPGNSKNLTSVGALVFFTTGDSLMRSDGTASGTFLIKSGLTNPGNLFAYNGLLYFSNDLQLDPYTHTILGKELWRSDGTAAGTYLLIRSDVGFIQPVINWNSFVYFITTTNTTGRELYRTNGTVAGTILLADINPGINDGVTSSNFIGLGSFVYFGATDPTHGTELWKTSGTSAGTTLVKDVHPGSADGLNPSTIMTADNLIYFSGNDGVHGFELWKSNGSSSGTLLVKDITTGPVSTDIYPMSALNNEIIFIVQDTIYNIYLYKSDGTASGTQQFYNFDHEIYEVKEILNFPIGVVNGKVCFFLGYGGGDLINLWSTDGTTSGTSEIQNEITLVGSVTNFQVLNNRIIFAAEFEGHFIRFYKTDGTSQGTSIFYQFNDTYGPIDATPAGNKIFFIDNNGPTYYYTPIYPDDSNQLMVSDLSSTESVRNIYGISLVNTKEIENANGKIFFITPNTFGTTTSEKNLLKLWTLDPSLPPCTSSGTILREFYPNITGSTVASIPVTTQAPTSSSLLSIFEGPVNVGNNYGAIYKGYICAPQTGKYVFWIASDDNSELWLSTSANSRDKFKVAYVESWTNSRQWTKFPTQKSDSIFLEAGKKYYIEALHKEAYGNDNLAVGWELPDGTLERPIPGTRLTPFVNHAPIVTVSSLNGTQFTPPASVLLSASVTDYDGLIIKTEYYQGSTLIGTNYESPFSLFTWNNVPAGVYTITAKTYDNDGAVTTSSPITITVGACTASGTILREYWANVSGSTITDIPVNTTPTSTSQLSIFEGPTNVANLYGTRYRGYICPPATGNYTFWIASDDNSQLLLSSDNDPAYRQVIAYVDGWTYPRTYDKYPSQQSSPIYLEAGKSYYIEALHKEAYGNDNLSVGWQLPNGTLERPIPGMRLSPYTGSESLSNSLQNSINNENEISVTILPNPTGKGRATLIIEGEDDSEKDVIIEIMNLQGHSVYKDKKSFEGRSKDLTINIDDQFQPGMYIVQLVIDGGVHIERLIVEY